MDIRKMVSAIAVVLSICMLSCSCGKHRGQDYTVAIENEFSIDGKTVIEDDVWSSADYIKVYPDADALYPDSSVIVLGTVKNVVYSDADGIATTYYDLEVQECWDGSLQSGDTITVAHNGGYLRGKVFNALHGYKLYDDDAVIKECVYDIPLPCVGDTNLLFLTEWENGTFCALNSFMARYFVDENGGISRFVPDDDYCRWIMAQGNDPLTLDEMRTKISRLQTEYEAKPPLSLDDDLEMIKEWYPQVYPERDGVAEKYEEACRLILDHVRNTASNVREKPSVLILNALNPCLAAGGDTFQNSMIKEAGGVNAAEGCRNKGNFTKLTRKEILKLDPDYVVIPETAAYDLNSDGWERLSAVRNGNVITIPEECMHQFYPAEVKLGRGDPESFIGTAYLLYRLHEDLYPWESFREDAAAYAGVVGEFWDSAEYLAEVEIEPYEKAGGSVKSFL